MQTTRKARTIIKTVGRTDPTAYAMHPTDWEAFDLAQDNEARYYYGGPSVLGNPRLWGLPVVESEALTAGQAIIADWKWAVLWQRMQAQILVSDSHSDFFIRNLIAILAEMRAAFAVIRPKAFALIDLTA
jgi:HK97 family phage major capsid protein